MKQLFFLLLGILAALLLTAAPARALTPVALALARLVPLNHARAVAPTQPVSFTFNQNLYSSSTQGLFVYSTRRGGLRTVAGPAVISTNTLIYAPPAAAPWVPGETVETILTTAVRGVSGSNIFLTRPQVRRFVVAAGGTGQGSFAPAPDVAVGSGAQAVALADVNGDNLPDLLTANAGAGTLSIRLGNGTGTYAAPATGAEVPAGPGAAALALADLDRDGDLDAVVACPTDNTVRVLLNGGTGSFSAGPVLAAGPAPASLALGDLNGDGWPDLAVANRGAASVGIYLATGAATFAAATSVAVGSQPAAVVLADLDNDLDLDLATANAAAGTVSYCLNGGAATFATATSVAVGTGPTGLALADVDGDTDPDLLAVDATGQASLRLNANGRFGAAGAAPALGSGVGNPLLADADGDGDLDLLAPASGGAVRVALNQPNSLAALTITSTAPAANAGAVALGAGVAVGFSQALAAGAGSNLQVFSSQRGGRRTGAVPATASGSTLGFAGPGGAGWLPGELVSYTVAAGTPAAGGAALARGRVGQFTTTVGGTGRGSFQASSLAVSATPAAGPYRLAVGDLTGDGRPDLVSVSIPSSTANPSTLNVFAGTGAGGFGAGTSTTVPTNCQGVALADVDGDGDLDVVCAHNVATNAATVLFNDGQGHLTANAQQPAIAGGAGGLALADVDGDGDLDLLLSAGGSFGIGLHLNDGSGTFAPAGALLPLLVATLAYNNPAVGDVDNDGDLDVVAAPYTTSTAPPGLYLNDGVGNFSTAPASITLTSCNWLTLADVDNNGTLDLLAANYQGRVEVYLNNGAGVFSAGPTVAVGGATWVVAADVDADHDLDLLAVSATGGTVAVALNAGNGTFGAAATSVFVGTMPYGLAVADLDGDGDLDFATADYVSATLTVALNGGTVLAAQAARATPALALWPNPAGTGGAATLTGAAPGTPVQVLDVLGRLVATAPADATGTARLAGLPAGLYLVRAGQATARLVVE